MESPWKPQPYTLAALIDVKPEPVVKPVGEILGVPVYTMGVDHGSPEERAALMLVSKNERGEVIDVAKLENFTLPEKP